MELTGQDLTFSRSRLPDQDPAEKKRQNRLRIGLGVVKINRAAGALGIAGGGSADQKASSLNTLLTGPCARAACTCVW